MSNPKSNFSFLFPGQGAQYAGMGKDIAEAFLEAKAVYERADDLLGYSLQKICFEGPEDTLRRTIYAQPAIFVTSLAILRVLKEKFSDCLPSFSAGLSLGEFTALVANGAMKFEDALLLVKIRAESMEAAAKNNPGTMASVIGLTQEACEAIAAEAGCEIANLNAPDQIVLSGTIPSVEQACKIAETKGAKRAILLNVGGAFHSALMREAKERLQEALKQTPIREPQGIFIPNARGSRVRDPEEIRSLLAKQLMSPVRWVETMAQAAQIKDSVFIEVGPGKVLKGLARRCQPGFEVLSCGDVRHLEKLDHPVNS